MQLRCYQCGWSFGISKDETVAALEALKASGGSHYDAHCPRCKRANKVSVEQLQRSMPRTRPEPGKSAG